MTALGPIAVKRVYFTCFACGLGRHPADAPLGLDGHLTTKPSGWSAWPAGNAPSPTPRCS